MTSVRDQLSRAPGNWFNELAPGDPVAYYSRGTVFDARVHLEKVLRLTTTQVILEDGRRFFRATGAPVGDRAFTHLYPADCPKVIQTLLDKTGEDLASKLQTLTHQRVRTAYADRMPWVQMVEMFAAETDQARHAMGVLERRLRQAETKWAGDKRWR